MSKSLIKGLPFYLQLFRKYLGNKIYFAVILNSFATLAEGFGIALIIPFLETLDKDLPQENLTGISAFFEKFLIFFNLPTNSNFILVLIAIAFIIKGILSFGAVGTIAYLLGKLLEKLKNSLVLSYSELNYLYYSKEDTGHFINIVNEQPDRVLLAFNFLNQVIAKIISNIGYLIILLFISWQFCFLTFLVAMISFYTFSYLNNYVRKLSRKTVIEKSKLSNLLVQSLQTFKYLISTGQTNLLSEFIGNSIRKLTKFEIKTNVSYAFTESLREPISVLGVLILMFVQITYFKQSLSSVLVSILLIYRAYSSIFGIQSRWQKVLTYIGSLEIIDKEIKSISRNKEINGEISLKDIKESIRFKNVSFSYGSGLKTIQNVNLVIPAKKTIAFVGESGSGKTTMADLISLILRPNSGEICIDNISSRDINLNDWRRNIGYISQENVMFDDTIANNICLWSGNIYDDQLMKKIKISAEKASLHQFIESLPNGYNTYVGDRGIRLSGGQRQRVFIARELFREPKLLILDEATSALDSNMEAYVQSSIDKLRGKITILIIAHRLSTIKNTDKVFVFDKGRLIEEGSYLSLSKNSSSKFFELLSKQINS